MRRLALPYIVDALLRWSGCYGFGLFQYSVAVRNARLDSIETTIGTSAVLKIFSGAEPANCAAADPAGLLATINLPSDWMTAAAAGVKDKTGIWSVAASGTGVAASFRIYDSGVAACHIQGSVTATGGGGDMTVDNTNIAATQTVTVTGATGNGFRITGGNA